MNFSVIGRKPLPFPLIFVLFFFFFDNSCNGQLQGNGNYMGQYAALPWSLLWLNPSYTGFYGGLGNVGQLTPDSSFLMGGGGQAGMQGRGGGYNYAMGAYNHATSRTSCPVLFTLLPLLCTIFFL